MQNNKTIIISIIAVSMAAVSLFYTIYVDVFGPPFRGPKYDVEIGERVSVRNNLNGLRFVPFIIINNVGKKEGKVSRVEAEITTDTGKTIKLETNSYQLKSDEYHTAPAPISINPNESWSSYIGLAVPMSEQAKEERVAINFDISNFYQEKYNEGDLISAKQVLIPDVFYDRVKKVMSENVAWLNSGEYNIKISIYTDFKSESPIWQKRYDFRISSLELKGLSEYQIKAYRNPHFSPYKYFTTYTVLPKLKEAVD